jgi:hypothetical protein
MTPFLTFREPNANGELQYYILQKGHPHYVGKISTVPKLGIMPSVPISGYNLYMEFCGTLRGNYIPAYKDVENEMVAVFNEMAIWYLVYRITPEEKKYKKFKIQPDVPTTNQ